jgi:hypothetical protein
VRVRGAALLDVLVGGVLALAVLGALTAAVAAGGRLVRAGGARAEAEDTAQLVFEALTFDGRRTGYDPAAGGITGVREAFSDRIELGADLDGDGVVDPASEETTAYVCRTGRLSRIIGRQSMPLADVVIGCAFRYLDEAGDDIPAPVGGVDAAGRSRIRSFALDLVLRPAGLRGTTARTVLVALRAAP